MKGGAHLFPFTVLFFPDSKKGTHDLLKHKLKRTADKWLFLLISSIHVTGYRLGIYYILYYNILVLPCKRALVVTCRVLDFRSKGPRFDPQLGHGGFF